MSTLRATNIKNPDSGSNNIVLSEGGGVVISGVTTVSAGSTSLPSISPSGDENTGIFFPSADTIAFGEGGSEAARFDSNGRFGLGATPSDWDADAGLSAIQLNGYGAVWNYYNNVQLGFNVYQSATGDRYLTTDEASKYTLDGSGNHVWYTAASGTAGDPISFTERMRVLTSGGLTFNGDTAAANALDDYEEGTFTPTISFTSGSATVADAVCGYIKVGRLVHVSGRFTLTSVVSPSGELTIGGLPFTADNLAGDGNRAGIQIFFENATSAIGTDIVGLVLDNTTNILVRASGTTGSGNTLAGNVGASTIFLFGGTYRSA